MFLPKRLQTACSRLCAPRAGKLGLTFVAAGVLLLAFLAQQFVPGGQWLSFLLLVALLAALALPPLAKKENRRLRACPLALGAAQGVASLSYLSNNGGLSPRMIALCALGVALVFTVLFTGLHARFSRAETPPAAEPDGADARKAAALIALLSFFAFVLAWLTVFPSDLSAPDTVNQLMQARGEIPYSNVHTVAHTLLLALFSRLDPSLGLYMLAGCTAAALLYGLFAGYLTRRGTPYPLLLLALTPFLMPKLTVALYTQPLKDLPYSLCVGLVTYFLMRLIDEGRLSRAKAVLLGVSLAFCTLFRLNGAVVTLLVGAYFAGFFLKRGQWGALWRTLLSALVCVAGLSLFSAYALRAESPENGFSVQVFGAGIAAVVAEEGEMSDAQTAQIEQTLPMEWMQSRYAPWNARSLFWEQDETARGDARTAVFNNRFVLALGAHKAEAVRLYIALFFQNPLLCLREIAFGTYCVWGWQIESVQFYYTNSFLCCALLLACCARKSRRRLFALLPIACNMLSIFVATVTNETRYLMPTFLLAPVLLLYFLLPDPSER